MLLNINHIAVSRNLSWLHKLDGLKDRPTMVRSIVTPAFQPVNNTRNLSFKTVERSFQAVPSNHQAPTDHNMTAQSTSLQAHFRAEEPPFQK